MASILCPHCGEIASSSAPKCFKCKQSLSTKDTENDQQEVHNQLDHWWKSVKPGDRVVSVVSPGDEGYDEALKGFEEQEKRDKLKMNPTAEIDAVENRDMIVKRVDGPFDGAGSFITQKCPCGWSEKGVMIKTECPKCGENVTDGTKITFGGMVVRFKKSKNKFYLSNTWGNGNEVVLADADFPTTIAFMLNLWRPWCDRIVDANQGKFKTIACSECKNQIYDDCVFCPQCGCHLTKLDNTED